MTEQGKYKIKQFLARMNYNTWLRLKKVFPAYKKESMSSYFNRLAIHLEMMRAKQ